MPASKSRSSTPAPAGADPESPSQVVADAVLRRFSDLEPSVRQIMRADLDEPARLRAITLFQTSLTADRDPMRIPANAIAAARLGPDGPTDTETAAN
jgi:hypothetical protein